jgi:phage shock protein A
MLNVLKTLLDGASARAEERVTDHFAIDLIEQKIREADRGLGAAKQTLASLILRQRTEEKILERLRAETADLEKRARLALNDGREELAADAAKAIAELENEQAIRRNTQEQLTLRIVRTRSSIEKAARRLIDLRQGMISARAVDAERKAQTRLNRTIGRTDAMKEAEDLIARVVGSDDPLAESQILEEIEADLSPVSIRDRLGEAGYGHKAKVSAADVLARLKTPTSTNV